MSLKIVYADDEVRFHKLVKIFLADEDFDIVCFSRGDELLDYLYENTVDLVLLDIMMPGLDGWETCREIRREFSIPVIMLTALNDEENEIQGITAGADDYISKPFSRELLSARIKGVLRRVKRAEVSITVREGILFDETERCITIAGNKIPLSPKEFGLLKYMVINMSHILSREQLLNHVWGYDYDGDPRTVDTHIKSLRARLGEKAGSIKNGPRQGIYL